MSNLPRHKHLTIRETKKGQTLRKKSQNPPPKKPRYLVQVLPVGAGGRFAVPAPLLGAFRLRRWPTAAQPARPAASATGGAGRLGQTLTCGSLPGTQKEEAEASSFLA